MCHHLMQHVTSWREPEMVNQLCSPRTLLSTHQHRIGDTAKANREAGSLQCWGEYLLVTLPVCSSCCLITGHWVDITAASDKQSQQNSTRRSLNWETNQILTWGNLLYSMGNIWKQMHLILFATTVPELLISATTSSQDDSEAVCLPSSVSVHHTQATLH